MDVIIYTTNTGSAVGCAPSAASVWDKPERSLSAVLDWYSTQQ